MLEIQDTIPPRSSVIASVGTEKSAEVEGVIEGDKHLWAYATEAKQRDG